VAECEERCDAEGWGGFTYNRTEETAYFHTQGGAAVREAAGMNHLADASTLLCYREQMASYQPAETTSPVHTETPAALEQTLSLGEEGMKSKEDKDAVRALASREEQGMEEAGLESSLFSPRTTGVINGAVSVGDFLGVVIKPKPKAAGPPRPAAKPGSSSGTDIGSALDGDLGLDVVAFLQSMSGESKV